MSAIGPDLPPHLLAKRKRQQEDTAEDATSTAPGAKPETAADTTEKRRRVMGPVMPPAPLEQIPREPAHADESDSDEDDLGPALPAADEYVANQTPSDEPNDKDQTSISSEKPKRDDWMTMAPAQDDLAGRMDPTRIRARGFNTGKSARSGNDASGASAWNETPEQKKKRLADEVLGITPTGPQTEQPAAQTAKEKARRDEATAQRLRQNMEKTRGPSLMDKHRTDKPEKVDDDPSKRAFDREKDMGHGSQISGMEKRDMINKASGYSSRFSGGSYL